MKFQNSQNDDNIEEGKKAMFSKAVVHDKPFYIILSLSPVIECLLCLCSNTIRTGLLRDYVQKGRR